MTIYTISKRQQFWQEFQALVAGHIEHYTVPQYGDWPDDQLSDFTARDIVVNMQRYLNRVDSNARGPAEAARDCLKLAHYACELHRKIIIWGEPDA